MLIGQRCWWLSHHIIHLFYFNFVSLMLHHMSNLLWKIINLKCLIVEYIQFADSS